MLMATACQGGPTQSHPAVGWVKQRIMGKGQPVFDALFPLGFCRTS